MTKGKMMITNEHENETPHDLLSNEELERTSRRLSSEIRDINNQIEDHKSGVDKRSEGDDWLTRAAKARRWKMREFDLLNDEIEIRKSVKFDTNVKDRKSRIINLVAKRNESFVSAAFQFLTIDEYNSIWKEAREANPLYFSNYVDGEDKDVVGDE